MPAATSKHSKYDVIPFECRVRFSERLSDVCLVSADAALPVLLKPKSVKVPQAPQPVQDLQPVNPAEFWKSEIALELLADRDLIHREIQEIRKSVEAFRGEQSQRLGEMQRIACELAATMATRLIHEQVNSGDFPIEAKVRDMLAQIEADAPATVFLNPQDLTLLEQRLAGEPLLAERDDIRLVRDTALARGACRLESREAVLLSELSRELQELRDELLRSLGNARP